MIERRYNRAAELRATANRMLRGVVVRYGEIATDRRRTIRAVRL